MRVKTHFKFLLPVNNGHCESTEVGGVGIQKVWFGVFVIWGLLLSGLFVGMMKTPGVYQLYELRALYAERHEELVRTEARVDELEAQRKRLEDDPLVQEFEIRRILGYVSPDELVFDFSKADTTGQVK